MAEDPEIALVRAEPSAHPAEGQWHLVTGFDAADVYVLLRLVGQRVVIGGVAVFRQPEVGRADLEAIPLGLVSRVANRPSEITAEQFFKELAPLNRWPYHTPELFADEVAMYYRAFAAVSRSPAKSIAEHSNVPIRRVHQWIADARRRGKLPPGRQGKVG